MESTRVFCGFPGVGKSTLVNNNHLISQKVLDSDSSKFDKQYFPDNYISHIKETIENNKYILASTHKTVRDALAINKIRYFIFMPEYGLKDEYIERYIKRGSPESFVKLMDDNWDSFWASCQSDTECISIVYMKRGEVLSKYMELFGVIT